MTAPERGRPLRVLQSTPPPGRQTNPYVSRLHDALRAAGVEVVPFSWAAALLGRYDLVHTHWPENLVRGNGWWRTAVRQALTALMVARLVVGRVPVVRTVHNVRPHEPLTSRRARALLRQLEAREGWWIRLNSHTPVPVAERAVTALHGDYAAWASGRPAPRPVPGRVVAPGAVRRYKRLDDLVEAFRTLDDPGLSLHVVGRCDDPDLTARLQQGAAQDSRVRLELQHLPDDDLAVAVGEAQVVVLPYRDMHNSGAVLLALSLRRPVLVPTTPVTEELAGRVGPAWVLLAPMTGADGIAAALAEALDQTRILPEVPPDLSAHDWDHVAELHVDLYRRATGRAGSVPGPDRTSGPTA